MKELNEYRKQMQVARLKRASWEKDREKRHNLLHHKQNQLARIRRLGKAGTNEERKLLREIGILENEIKKESLSARNLDTPPVRLAAKAAPQAQPWELIEGLSDRLPFVLLPLRVEARFLTVDSRKELWVRIFPDDIVIHTHEENLTVDEVDTGKTYWQEFWRARQGNKADKRKALEKGAWRALALAYGGPRAAWIARRTRPTSLAVSKMEDLQFPQFPEETLKAESWSQAPRSKVMPDRFVVMGFFQGKEVFRKAGSPIRDPLIVGPDPQATEPDLAQKAGRLVVGEDIAWIYDFQKAVEAGMGMQIELEPPFDEQGLSQLLVLGLRLSATEKESQALLENLFENHSYARDGLSLVPQGTPTNNTDRQGSGFSSIDQGAESSFAVETGDPLFKPTGTSLMKCDGQRLVEALGIRHQLFQRIQHSDRNDLEEALCMNRALWSATGGYYLEEMLDLSLERIEQVRAFFSEDVTGRGPLPAIRVGSQPYGILLTSDFSHWKWSPGQPALEDLYVILRRIEENMLRLLPRVARIGASEDPSQDLLHTLGQQASSVEFYRRHAVGLEHLWNFQVFMQAKPFEPDAVQKRERMMAGFKRLAESLAKEAGIDADDLPSIFRLSFFEKQDLIPDPVVDDIPADESEKLSETRQLQRIYQAPDPQNPGKSMDTNYIGWLAFSPYQTIKNQSFMDSTGKTQPIPRPLLYRMLRSSLLEALHDAALRLYTKQQLVQVGARREFELTNIQTGQPESRRVTRWEFLDADISQVMPQAKAKNVRVAEFLLSEEGLSLSQAAGLRETLENIRALADPRLSTAQLERAFAEHIDLCSYRLDAWQTGCFNRRLQEQRFPPESGGAFEKRVKGLYLGAFGWLENLRPGTTPAPADLTSIPTSLHDPQQDGLLLEQPDNAGFIHGPSLNHAVTAAILRSAYLTHFDPQHPEKMAVDLSSERVRLAQSFLEGVRNGQELGALLGYQFERGLHDRQGNLALDQFILNFRQKYPLVADKITEDPDGEPIESKEARNVLDGYALVEAAFIQDNPLSYPYDVAGLPLSDTARAKAIIAEVARMADSLDAIADLALAEGVYQVTQGNFDRAGAMLKAMTQGESPADPEIVRTPRSGTAITQRVALHLPTDPVANPWPGPAGRRAVVEPGLNAWLGSLLPRPNKISYAVQLGGGPLVEQTLAGLALQPIDLVYMIGDDLVGETTELESRIIFLNRRQQKNDELEVKVDIMAKPADPQAVTLFQLLPLLGAVRRIVTSCRPLGASDYELPSESTSDLASNPNPQGIDLDNDLKGRVQTALKSYTDAKEALKAEIPIKTTSDGQPIAKFANAEKIRTALRALSDFGLQDAFPLSAFGASDQAKATLTRQAVNVHAIASRNQASAEAFKAAGDNLSTSARERADRYRSAIQAIFGPSFNLIPSFTLKNQAELQAAANFRDAAPAENLIRHHKENPLVVDEWFQGAARVQPNLETLETITILGENFGKPATQQKPIQLPFHQGDHWVAVAFPDAFIPQGEFLSVLQVLPDSGFHPDERQSGLLIDEWVEVIPNKTETTGIAFHFNQPNSEPPQVLLLAVTPEVTGKWTWDKLVGVVQNTFQRAQLRAIEPEQIDDTAFAQLLPAIITPVSSSRQATITTDLVHRTAVQFQQ